MLRAKGIHKIYRDGKKDLHVLKGIDFEVKKGETVSISGPSGAGKSTLLHILGGIDRPNSGKVFLDGLDFYALSDTKKAGLRNQKIGFVFQFYHLLPEFTALENVIMPGLLAVGRERRTLARRSPPQAERTNDEIRKRARDLMQEFGLGDRLRHRPAELSGGEQQRVAIARALINNPDVLLCDEPTGNLDSKMGEEILNILFETGERTAIVIVTHDMEIAKKTHRVIELRDGKVRG